MKKIEIEIPIYRAKKIDSDEYINGDLFNKKYIILESELNKQIIDAIEHINEVLVSECSTECKNEHNALKNMLYKLQSNERFEHIYEIQQSTLAIHFNDMLDSQGNKIFASLREDGRGGDIFEHSVNCRLDSPRPHNGTYWISCKSPLVYKDFGFYFKYHIIDSTPKYADGKITNRKGLARFEKNLKVIGIQD